MTSSKPLRILVIDDSPPFRRQVCGALEASGLEVVEASEGYEALWRVRAEGVFDLILADIHMPNLDGIVFIREVRKLPEYKDVPIFVLTSDGSRDRREEGRAAGASAWLLKPPDLPALVHTVHAALLQLIKARDPNVAARPSLTPVAASEAEGGVKGSRGQGA
jgi:two-component system chemotaxis response regulator CheY